MSLDQKLKNIQDPQLLLTLEQMGVQLHEDQSPTHYQLGLHGGFPTHTLAKTMTPLLHTALQNKYPHHKIDLDWSFFIQSHRTQMLGKSLRGIKNTIAIASGKGGVGKSTVTINLAAALAKAGARVGVLDADIYGPSIPTMLGKHAPLEMQGDYYLPIQAFGIHAMSIAYLMKQDQALIWRGPMLSKALIQMLDSTYWDELDYLLIDLPPGTGDIQLSLVQKIPLTAAIIVTTPQGIATLDAEKAITLFQRTSIDVLGIIENMSLHICSHCQHTESIFGEGGGNQLSQQHDLPLLGQLPLDRMIQRSCEEGIPIASGDSIIAQHYQNIALKIAIDLAKKPLNYAGKL